MPVGATQGPRPLERVLLGLGGCGAFDGVHILRKARRTVAGCEVAIDAERAVARSADEYCSVARMLASGATITHAAELRGE